MMRNKLSLFFVFCLGVVSSLVYIGCGAGNSTEVPPASAENSINVSELNVEDTVSLKLEDLTGRFNTLLKSHEKLQKDFDALNNDYKLLKVEHTALYQKNQKVLKKAWSSSNVICSPEIQGTKWSGSFYGDMPTEWYLDIEFSDEAICIATLSISKSRNSQKGPPVIDKERFNVLQISDGVLGFLREGFDGHLNLGSFINVSIENGVMSGVSLLQHEALSEVFNGKVLPMPFNEFQLEKVN